MAEGNYAVDAARRVRKIRRRQVSVVGLRHGDARMTQKPGHQVDRFSTRQQPLSERMSHVVNA